MNSNRHSVEIFGILWSRSIATHAFWYKLGKVYDDGFFALLQVVANHLCDVFGPLVGIAIDVHFKSHVVCCNADFELVFSPDRKGPAVWNMDATTVALDKNQRLVPFRKCVDVG